MARENRDRHLAIAYGAADAKTLIATRPGLASVLTQADLDHIQYVLDAAIVNIVVKAEANEIYRQSVTGQIGNETTRDPKKVRQSDAKLAQSMPVSEADHRLRLDYRKMLTADALSPQSNNPDEANYLVQVRANLDHLGIWLRMTQPFRAGPHDGPMVDPRRWEIWFSLGAYGKPIKSDDARIDREELLGNVMLGSGYERSVMTGPVQVKLHRSADNLREQLNFGQKVHFELKRDFDRAFFGVAEISNAISGAKLPPMAIWDGPEKLLLKGLWANTGGDVISAQIYFLASAILVEHNLRIIEIYAKRSGDGAATAAKVATGVLATAIVIEAFLLPIYAAGIGVTGAGAGASAEAAAAAEASNTAAQVDALIKGTGLTNAELAPVRAVQSWASNAMKQLPFTSTFRPGMGMGSFL